MTYDSKSVMHLRREFNFLNKSVLQVIEETEQVELLKINSLFALCIHNKRIIDQ